jgi:hypothetical protein
MEVGGRYQEVEIGKTTKGEIAIGNLSEDGTFVGDRGQLLAVELLQDAQHFGGKPQVAAQVDCVGRLQFANDFRGNSRDGFGGADFEQVARG